MHTIKYIVFGISLLFLMYSCETDFDTTAEWEDITIVYGIIDQNDSLQSIKINKAFLGEGNVLQMAQVYDSSNYPFNMKVWLEAFDENDQLVQTIEFDTATSYIPPYQDAVFPTGAQKIYTGGPDTYYEIKYVIQYPDTLFSQKIWLNDQNTYTLNILYPDSSKFISAATGLIMDFRIVKPLPYSKFIKFVPNSSVPREFTWEKPDNDEGKFKYELLIKFNYQELTTQSTVPVDKSINLVSNVTVYPTLGNADMTYYYWDDNFFVSCVNDIPYSDASVEANITARYSVDIEIVVSVAAEALNLFMQVYKPSSSIVQEKPLYTNIENGIGVFSARYRIRDYKLLNPETVQDLRKIDDNFLKFEY